MLVIDANIAIKLVALEKGRDAALDRLEKEAVLIAPEWLLVEAGNALWRKVRLGELDRTQAEAAMRALPEFLESLEGGAHLITKAQALAFELDHWIYDTIYLALALERQTILLTTDRKFANASERAGYGDTVELLTWKGQPE